MRAKIIFMGLVLAALIMMVVFAWGYPSPANLFPLLIGIPLIMLTGVEMVMEIRRTGKKGTVENRNVFIEDVSKHWDMLLWIVALLVLFYFLGHSVGLPLFLFFYLKLHGEDWPVSILITAAIAAVICGGFGLGLRMSLYKGLLPY